MDIRSIKKREPKIENGGSILVWWLFELREMFEATNGGYLELVIEFEVKGGQKVNPHKHSNYEFFYITHGRGFVKIEDETCKVYTGDLIKIPPDKEHSIWPEGKNASIHCFCFAIGLKGAPSN